MPSTEGSAQRLLQENALEERGRVDSIDRALVLLVTIEAALAVVIAWLWPGRLISATSSATAATLLVAGSSTAMLWSWRWRSLRGGNRNDNGYRLFAAAGATLTTSLFVHLGDGRFESYALVLVTLAVLSAYCDWRVVVTGVLVFTGDEVARTLLAGPLAKPGGAGTDWSALARIGTVVLPVAALVAFGHALAGERRRRLAATIDGARNQKAADEARAELAEREQTALDQSDRDLFAMLAGHADPLGRPGRSPQETRQLQAMARAGQLHARTAGQALAVGAQHCETVGAALGDQRAAIDDLCGGGTAPIHAAVETLAGLALQQRRLALNAAIEAAHADAGGESHGMDLPEIAEQIRALADRTGESARQLEQLVAGMVRAGEALSAAATGSAAEVARCRARIEAAEQSTGCLHAIVQELGLLAGEEGAPGSPTTPNEPEAPAEPEALAEPEPLASLP